MLLTQQVQKTRRPLTQMVGCVALTVLLASSTLQATEQVEVGASLNKKIDINIADIPMEVLSVIKQEQPDFTVKEAEKEFKHGKVYFDIEGEKSDGSEVEFDLLLVNKQWSIMEIQRDVTLNQCPKAVVTAYQGSTNFTPQRIIESKQSTGEVIYEFYSTLSNGKEVKHEIKFLAGKAEVLETEWAH